MVLFLGLFCIIGGLIIVSPLFLDKYQWITTLQEKISPYKIIIGLAVLIIGGIKLIVPYHKPGRPLIPIFGDLFPSLFAILTGLFISLEFFETLKGFQGASFEKVKITLQKYQFTIGFACIFFGVFHWFLFKVIFF